jgi:hypothetical protein
MSEKNPSSNEDSSTYSRKVKAIRTQREEARTVLDHHIQLSNDIDGKAMRTVRVEIILLAALVSAAQFVGPESQFINPLTKYGTMFVVLSLMTGIATYSYSSPDFGTGPQYNDELLENQHSEHEWLGVLLSD